MKFKTWLASIILGINLKTLFERLDDQIGSAVGGIMHAQEMRSHEDMMYELDRINRRYLEPAYKKVSEIYDALD